MFQQDIWLTTSFILFYSLFLLLMNGIIIGKFFNFTILVFLIILGVGINAIFILDTIMSFKKAFGHAKMIKEDKNKSFLDFLVYSHKIVKDDHRVFILNISFIILFVITTVFGIYFLFYRNWILIADIYMFLILSMSYEMHKTKYRL